ncbi:MAG: hypothetical protein M1836_005049 [Candelina mexicana]|nr:MAG: hypothetical protein M1836_005049 [Candelina mexicana]
MVLMSDPRNGYAALKVPFYGLTAPLNFSATSVVYGITAAIVLKVPITHLPYHPDSKVTEKDRKSYARNSEESVESIECEKAIYAIINAATPHPNVLQSLLCVPQGIFLPRMTQTLEERFGKVVTQPIDLDTRYRWAKELSRAAAWLETLDVVHGDLRPANIFLNATEQIKLADFNCSVRPGELLKGLTEPYWMYTEDGRLDDAGPKTEQFAIGTCFFFIFNGCDPELEDEPIGGPQRDEKLLLDRTKLGHITTKCWNGVYESIAEVAADVEKEPSDRPWSAFETLRGLYSYVVGLFRRDSQGSLTAAKEQRLALRKFCEDYVHSHAIDYGENAKADATNEKV